MSVKFTNHQAKYLIKIHREFRRAIKKIAQYALELEELLGEFSAKLQDGEYEQNKNK